MNSAGQRPDPDQLLATVQAEETRAGRGRLRIFFGASAGVGKTYAMLEAARVEHAAGRDIVVGYVEPHGRQETERLLEGLEQQPVLPVRYRGTVGREFDLDAALRRRPETILVDELAHSNFVEGEPQPRHAKRWQDVDELLDAGINVWTTVNVQHLESLNDLVAQITGVRQRETIPDRVFDEADDVELIDLPPDDLLARLKAGKVYHPEQAGVAAERFFRKGNLLALREIALRRTADRVDAAARASLAPEYGTRPWLARDRLLVAIGPDEQAEQVVRAGKRLADALDAQWTVVYVETPQLLRLPEAERNRRIDLLRLAESLGAETVTLDGPRAAGTLLEYARTRKATRVLVGAPKRRGWRAWLRPSTATELVKRAQGFDVITLAVPEQPLRDQVPAAASYGEAPQPLRWSRYLRALAGTAICTAIGLAMYPYFELTNVVMVYMLGAAVAGLRLGRGPATVAAIANILALDFCFVPPRFAFAVHDVQYLVTFSVMLIVTMVIATLMASVRQQTRVAGARERRTALLYAMTRELAATRDLPSLSNVAVTHVAEVFDSRAVILLPNASGRLQEPGDAPLACSLQGADLSIAQWVADHGQRAGLGSDTLPAAPALYLPLRGSRTTLGVLAVQAANRRRVLLPEQRHLLETFAGQIGLAIERIELARAAESSRIEAETESLRNTLLASISHDLRTPLSVIAGAASTLADPAAELEAEGRRRLAQSIETRALDMSDLVSNVLDLSRLEAGRVVLRRDWQTIDDLVGAALSRTGSRLDDHLVELALPEDLPEVDVDATLVVQLFANLFENAAKHTPAGTRLSVSAHTAPGLLTVIVEDDGPGLPPGDPDRLFTKFQRGRSESEVTGAGLGLAICRAIARVHGGEIRAYKRVGGGARFDLTLPIAEAEP